MKPLASIDGVVDVTVVRGADADDAAPSLLIEIPHGATRTRDFTDLAARLTSPLPDGLVDFFHVNTDVGAPELAQAVAERVVAAAPRRAALVLRCRIPRTLIDCNRRLDASPADFKAGKVTPGLMPWITTEHDRALLRELHDAYVGAVAAADASLAADGALLLLHSYAPRTVDVEVDDRIVASLRAAYRPEVVDTWPLRPELDVIGRSLDGVEHAPPAVTDALRAELSAIGLAAADSATYPMHPSTLAWDHVMRRPGRALCLEVRRDLLADPFDPFAEMHISPTLIARLAAPIAAAVARWW